MEKWVLARHPVRRDDGVGLAGDDGGRRTVVTHDQRAFRALPGDSPIFGVRSAT